jgi:hypothetical protein
MGQFRTSMQATVRVPQEGFTVEDLKKHLRESRIPNGARLRPTVVQDVDVEAPGAVALDRPKRDPEVGFVAEWAQ